MRNPDAERRELLEQIAGMYYFMGMSQQEIALHVHLSRSNVSRMLTLCRECGVVDIRVRHMRFEGYRIREELIERFGLRDAIVTQSDGSEQTRIQTVGAAGARYLEEHLRDGLNLGIGWGTTILQTVENFKPEKRFKADVVQLMGGTSKGELISDGFELTKRLAARLNGKCAVFHAPLVVNSALLKELLLKEPLISAQFEKYKCLDMAIMGIGVEKPSLSRIETAGYFLEGEMETLAKSGVVGNVCGYLIDGDGALCDLDFNRRVIGIDWETLKSVPDTVGVACGSEKAQAIRACLTGGIIKTVITDEQTARAVLAL